MADGFEVRVEFPARKLAALWDLSPATTAYHVRDAIGAIMGKFRRELLNRHRGSPMANLVSRAVHYRVFPKDLKKQGGRPKLRGQQLAAARAHVGGLRIDDIRLRVWSTSEVALAHETGATMTSADGMVVPVGAYRRAIDRLRAGTPIAGRRGRKSALVALRDAYLPPHRVVKRGGVFFRKEADGKLTPVAVDAKSVRLPARLQFYATWRRLEAARDASLQKAVDRIVQDLADGVTHLNGLDLSRDVFRSRAGVGSGLRGAGAA